MNPRSIQHNYNSTNYDLVKESNYRLHIDDLRNRMTPKIKKPILKQNYTPKLKLIVNLNK